MEKITYGTREITATVAGIVVLVLVQWLEMNLIKAGILPKETGSWVQFYVAVVAVVAVFFGPISGTLCGLGGTILLNAASGPHISYPNVFSLGLYGLFIGLYYSLYHFKRRRFTPADFVDFNAVSVISGIICMMFFVPLVSFLVEDMSIFDTITVGAKAVIGNSILVGIICPVIMAIVAFAENRKRDRV